MLGSRYFSRGFYIHVCLNSDEITAYMYVFTRQRETMSHCRTFTCTYKDKNFVKDIPTRPQTGKNRHAFKRGGRPTPTS